MSEQTGTSPLIATIPVTFTDVDLTDIGHTALVTNAVASGATTDFGLNTAGLIGLITPAAVIKAAGSSSGSVDLGFSAASTAFDYLSIGDTLTLTYTVAINDLDGGATTQTFIVNITGTNDAPVINAITQQTLPEQTGTSPLATTIPVTFTDVDLTDVGHTVQVTNAVASGATTGLGLNTAGLIGLITPATVIKAAGSSSGSVDLGFSAASTAFDYLGIGDTLMLTYTVAINDLDGGTTTQTFVVNITGTNDAPVINAITQQTLPEQTGTSPLATTIPVTFTDVDLTDIGHTALVTNAVASGATTGLGLNTAGLIGLITPATVIKASGLSSGSVDLGFSAASTAFDYLGIGDTLTLTYTVAINDLDGGATTQTFVVNITGTNDAPVINAITQQTLPEQTGTSPLATTIPVTFTDVDLTDIGHTALVTNAVASGATTGLGLNTAGLIGLITPAAVIKAAGSSSGSVDLGFSAASTAFDYLGIGDTLTLTYTVAINDLDGGATTQTLTVNVTGTNDAPVITSNSGGATAAISIAGKHHRGHDGAGHRCRQCVADLFDCDRAGLP